MGIAGFGEAALLRLMEAPPAPAPDPVPHLTYREMEVLLLMCQAECLLEKQIADRLVISLSTFKRHKEKVFWKCKVHGRLQLIVKAVRWKLVDCYCGGPHGQGGELLPPAASLGLP